MTRWVYEHRSIYTATWDTRGSWVVYDKDDPRFTWVTVPSRRKGKFLARKLNEIDLIKKNLEWLEGK